jgi:hypothetical protein
MQPELGAVAENFHAPYETAGETRHPAGLAMAKALVGCQPCCRLKGNEPA